MKRNYNSFSFKHSFTTSAFIPASTIFCLPLGLKNELFSSTEDNRNLVTWRINIFLLAKKNM